MNAGGHVTRHPRFVATNTVCVLKPASELETVAAMLSLQLLHIEDDPDTHAALLAHVRDTADTIVWASTGAHGLRLAQQGGFDVIVLDRMLPDMDGMAVLAALRQSAVVTPVLVLSALGRAEHRVEGLEAGADDYLTKPYDPAELVARVRALRRRASTQGHSPVIVHGSFECHLKARTAYRGGRHLALSPKEFDMFRYFMENAGEVVTRTMLLREIWNMNFDPQTNVIDVNIGRLRRKLEEGAAVPLLETVWGSGYRLLGGQ